MLRFYICFAADITPLLPPYAAAAITAADESYDTAAFITDFDYTTATLRLVSRVCLLYAIERFEKAAMLIFIER